MSAVARHWYDADPERESWRDDAACRGMAPADGRAEPHPFFPVTGQPSPEVVAVCGMCPVRADCSAEGVGRHGVWAGRLHVDKNNRRAL